MLSAYHSHHLFGCFQDRKHAIYNSTVTFYVGQEVTCIRTLFCFILTAILSIKSHQL